MAVCGALHDSCTCFAGADVVPILLRLIFHRSFTPGPFKLGAAQVVVNLTAIVWLVFNVVRHCPLKEFEFASFVLRTVTIAAGMTFHREHGKSLQQLYIQHITYVTSACRSCVPLHLVGMLDSRRLVHVVFQPPHCWRNSAFNKPLLRVVCIHCRCALCCRRSTQ